MAARPAAPAVTPPHLYGPAPTSYDASTRDRPVTAVIDSLTVIDRGELLRSAASAVAT
jgi:hypothetical protein